jgi:hypothetical protein
MHEYFMESGSKINLLVNLEPGSFFLQAKTYACVGPSAKHRKAGYREPIFMGKLTRPLPENATARKTARGPQRLICASSPVAG